MPPVNNNFVDAIPLLAGTHTISGISLFLADVEPGENFQTGNRSVWYKLVPPENNNGGTFTNITISSDTYAYLDILRGTTLSNLITIPGFTFSSPSTNAGPYYANQTHVYVRIASNNDGTVSFTYTFTPNPNALVESTTDVAGVELKSPGAPYTRYPGVATAIRVSSYMGGARGTLTSASDSDAPSLTYVGDTQTLTSTFANMSSVANAVAAADTLVIDLDTLGLEVGIYYGIWALIKTVGTTPSGFAKNRESFRFRQTTQLWYHSADNTSPLWRQATESFLFNNTNQWRYIYLNLFRTLMQRSDVLTIKCFTLGDPGLEIRIAQLVMLPYTVDGSNRNDFSFTDFQPADYPSNHVFPWQPTEDDRPDSLGNYTFEYNSTYTRNVTPGYLEYQSLTDPSEAEWSNKGIETDNWDSVDSRMWHRFGPMWTPAINLETDNFSRTVAPIHDFYYFSGDGDPNWHNVFLRSPYGYVWMTDIEGLASPTAWGLDQYYGYDGPSYMQMDGSSAIMAFGGLDTQIYAMSATLGLAVDSLGSPLTNEMPPVLDDLEDYIIEGVFSWIGQIDGTDPNGGDIGSIGKTGSDGAPLGTVTLAMVLNQQPDGKIYGKLVGKQSNWYYVNHVDIVGPTLFDTSYTPGRKIHLKIRRRRYILEGKVWYDGDTEPSTWAYSGSVPTSQTHSIPPSEQKPLLYPYIADVGYTAPGGGGTGSAGWSSPAFHRPFFRSAVSSLSALSTPSGQQTRVVVSWDSFKVDYDPDGDTTKGAHVILKDNAQVPLVTAPVIPYTRQAWVYYGKRVWSSLHNGSDGPVNYSWLDEGAATLASVNNGYYWFRKVKYEVAAVITGVVSMCWKQSG